MAKIFWMEDDAAYAAILKKALHSAGHEVVHASNGEDGLRRVTAEGADLILLDIGLPAKDGFEVLEALKSGESTKRIPVVMLSRLCSREDLDRCFGLGCDEYLIKTQHGSDDIVRHINRRLGAAGFSIPEGLAVGAFVSVGLLGFILLLSVANQLQ
ncbi:response regulator [Candidatus Uhrbacteria bacterium]|nr:response regulator [Candidatus Uhrbacteria bacterium]